MTQEALKLALEALEDACGECCNAEYKPCFQRKAITAIKKALAQEQEQEPLTENGMYRLGYHNGYGFGEAYGKANAPQRTWVGLTEEDDIDWEDGGNLKDLVKAIEAKLKDKNIRGQE